MKRSGKKKRIFIIIGAVLLVAIAVALINVWPLLTMKPAATGRVAETEIIALRNNMNSLYFLNTGDGYIAVDAGSEADKIEKAMQELGIDPLDVKHVLMTHSDYDHVAALAIFANAKIYMSEDELQMIDGRTKRNAAQSNSLPAGVDKDSLVLLQGGQELAIGGHSVVCIKAPGHTPGSMAYMLDEGYLFTGDTLRVSGGSIGIHPFTMDEETAKVSIQKLKDEMSGCELVLSAHYGYYQPGSLK